MSRLPKATDEEAAAFVEWYEATRAAPPYRAPARWQCWQAGIEYAKQQAAESVTPGAEG
jgi:hypothetical protein